MNIYCHSNQHLYCFTEVMTNPRGLCTNIKNQSTRSLIDLSPRRTGSCSLSVTVITQMNVPPPGKMSKWTCECVSGDDDLCQIRWGESQGWFFVKIFMKEVSLKELKCPVLVCLCEWVDKLQRTILLGWNTQLFDVKEKRQRIIQTCSFRVVFLADAHKRRRESRDQQTYS